MKGICKVNQILEKKSQYWGWNSQDLKVKVEKKKSITRENHWPTMKAQYTGINNKLKTNLKLFFLVPKLVVKWVLGSILCLFLFWFHLKKNPNPKFDQIGVLVPTISDFTDNSTIQQTVLCPLQISFRNLAKYCKISYMAHIMQWLCLYSKFEQNCNESIKSNRIKLRITNQYPITKHFFRHSSSRFILSDLKCYGSATWSYRNHLWSANEKKWWKNSKKKNKFSNSQNAFFPLFLFFGPLLLLISFETI